MKNPIPFAVVALACLLAVALSVPIKVILSGVGESGDVYACASVLGLVAVIGFAIIGTSESLKK